MKNSFIHSFFLSSPEVMPIDFRERGKEGEKKWEKNIDQLPLGAPRPGTKPAT